MDRWYPSSKRCSGCGHTVNKMPLNVREWICPECELIHDRDINAARNVLAAGLAVSGVSPWRICKSCLHLGAPGLDSLNWESPSFTEGSKSICRRQCLFNVGDNIIYMFYTDR
ncbi:zinc ribbon domain-containing protein [Nitrosomonas cryotolerans]|uniref:zinc ribbon domain-containing protein n=1 Tax=Nitrosomonas cryotolerans TaxID=44575 RepID=UPI0034E96FF1